MVHVGDNKWEMQTDDLVLPKFVSNIATNMCVSAHNYKLAVEKTLDSYLEDMTCGGEHGATNNIEECRRVRACYRKTIQHLKHILFNFTKDTIGATKAQAIICP
jgi:hypothetical protein